MKAQILPIRSRSLDDDLDAANRLVRIAKGMVAMANHPRTKARLEAKLRVVIAKRDAIKARTKRLEAQSD